MNTKDERPFSENWSAEKKVNECLRYAVLLEQIAERLLEGETGAEEAVSRCIIAAVRVRIVADSEGAFRSWLMRLVIEEALRIRRERRNASNEGSEEAVFATANWSAGRVH